MNCNVDALASSGSFLNMLLDPQQFQATKVYLLALILKANGGTDYTDMAALMEQMKPNDRLSTYQQQSANIEFLIEQAVAAGVPNLNQSAFQSAIGPAFNANAKTLRSAEIFLSCQLASSGGGSGTFDNAISASNISIDTVPGVTLLSFPLLASTAGDIKIVTNPNLITIQVPLLNSIGGNLLLYTNNSLSEFNADALTVIAGANGMDIDGCANLTKISMQSLVNVTSVSAFGFDFDGCPSLAMVDLTSLVTLACNMSGQNCASLTDLVVPNWVPTDGTTIDLSNCSLSVASVELILRRCVLAGVTTCTINLSGGTNAGTASLNAQGQADVATLGAQLTINP